MFIKFLIYCFIYDKIIEEGAISDTNLRLLINEIVVLENSNKIQLVISMKAPFGTYGEVYKNGKTVLKHRGDYESITA